MRVFRLMGSAVVPRRATRAYWFRVLVGQIMVGGAVAVTGCGDQSLAPPALPAEKDLYWQLSVNHQAVLMSTTAPYDTLQLTATPLNALHEPMSGASAPVFTSSDPDNVVVTADGKIQALHRTTQPATIAVSVSVGNVKRTVNVQVMATDTTQPIVPGSFSLHAASMAESTKVAVMTLTSLTFGMIPVHVVDINGAPIPIYGRDVDGVLPVQFESEDTTALTVGSTGRISGKKVGSARMVGHTTAFGVAMTDTVAVRVGWPILVQAGIKLGDPYSLTPSTSYYLDAPDITVGVGGAVRWSFLIEKPDGSLGTDTADVTFADTDLAKLGSAASVLSAFTSHFSSVDAALCHFLFGCTLPSATDTGNIHLIGNDIFSVQGTRVFLAPGVYEYTIYVTGERHGSLHGRVTVVDEREAP